MKPFMLVVIASLLVASCKDDDKKPIACNYENPLEMSWMQAKILAIEQGSHESESYIEQYERNGEYYFFFNSCCTTCNVPNWYYDCGGNQTVLPEGTNTSPTGQPHIIWRGDNFKCQLM